MQIEIGSKLFCNWGAMFPTEEYEVIGFGKDYAVAQNDNEVKHFALNNIKREGERSANGSPIGIFLKNA